MARFRGTVQGVRGEASRLGSTNSGLTANVNGWELGVRVEAVAMPDGDLFKVWATRGSNGRGSSMLLGTLRLTNGFPDFETAAQEANRVYQEKTKGGTR